MRKTLTLVHMALLGTLIAQKPEQIHPFARHQYAVSYLKEQSELWKKEVEKDPKSTNAWYNYYYANRNLGFSDKSRSQEEKYAVISKIVDEMGKAIPASYEYNLCRWMHGGWNMSMISYLEKAQQLGPDRPEHLDYSIVFAEMKGDMAARDKWSRKKLEAGQFSTGLMYYNYNVLVGLPEKAILITSGDNDTFPLWYLQSTGIRPDVTIVHTALVGIPEYRDPVLRKLGIKSWKEGEDPRKNKESKTEDLITYLSDNAKNPVYLGLTANSCSKQAVTENLYLTGLAYAHSKTPLDNMAIMKRNFEQLYALDYLDKMFFSDISEDLVKIVNGNYVVPMLKLFEHYRLAGETKQAEKMKRLLLSITKNTESEEEVRKKLVQL